ncbi:MAG TPA: MFS transporter [Kofleriaceae bacterium]|nr:MFS transporter [Kofleriaceae bacterium]
MSETPADGPPEKPEKPDKPDKRGAWAHIFASRRMAVTAALGFASGLPLLLTGQVLALWLTDAKIDVKTIALFASVGLPYTFKFLWAPLLDRYVPPFLGRRRGWMLIAQVGLIAVIVAMASADPASNTVLVAQLAIALAALSATQDVAIDAWRADVLAPEERAAGSAVYVLGYRVAMLTVGTAGLILADHTSYRVVFLGTAVLLALCIAATFLAEEPRRPVARPHNLYQALVMPLADFFRRLGWAALVALAFAAFYKFGDQMVDGLISTFWRRELGLSKTEIGTFTKAAGFAGVATGGLLAGLLTPRLGTRNALILFGLLQAATNLLYIALAIGGKSYPLVGAAIFIDYIANTMGTAVFMAVFIAMCSKEVSATQYALLTSLSSVGKRVFGWAGGDIVASYGWATFFGATALMAIPGLLLVMFLPRHLMDPPRQPAD